MILAIDPGPEQSAWVAFEDGLPAAFGIDGNDAIRDEVVCAQRYDVLAVEMIASYGMPVGADVFETCVWIGRFEQRWEDTHPDVPGRVYRRDVKLHLCGSARAKDANVRQALIDRYGPSRRAAIGLKHDPGPLYGITSHVWSALAVAVTVADNESVTQDTFPAVAQHTNEGTGMGSPKARPTGAELRQMKRDFETAKAARDGIDLGPQDVHDGDPDEIRDGEYLPRSQALNMEAE